MLDCCCFLQSQHVEMRCCLWQTTVQKKKKISWSQMWPFHQRSPKSHQWFHQISTNSIALTCTHSSNNIQVTLISLCESVTLSPRPPVRRKKDRLRSWIRFLLLAQISVSELCLLSDYRNYTPSLALQEGVLVTRGLHCNGINQCSSTNTPAPHLHSDCGSALAYLPHGFAWLLSDVSTGKTIKRWKNNTDMRITIFQRGNALAVNDLQGHVVHCWHILLSLFITYTAGTLRSPTQELGLYRARCCTNTEKLSGG